jgi:NADH:ubiquinone oxidoreductase subunit K
VNLTLVGVLFVAAALVATGLLAAAWRRDALAALAGVPLTAAGAGLASVGTARFGSTIREPAAGQEAAVLVMLVALGVVVLGAAVAGPLRGATGDRPVEGAPPAARAPGRRRR